jgi:hypothetical protein
MIGKNDHIPEYNPIGQEGIEKVPRTRPAFGGGAPRRSPLFEPR